MRRGVVVAVGVAVVLAVAYLLAPPLGTDLSAQVARADFFAAHGFTPIDMRWYAGVNQFGYSLVSQILLGVVGVRVVAVVSLLVSSAVFAALLARAKVARPVLGGVIGAGCIAGGLVSGRVTYGLGVTFGLLALLALTARNQATRYAGAAVGGFLAAVTSPVAGLFVGLAGVAVLLARYREGLARYGEGLVLAACGAVGLAVTGLVFGEGGTMNISPRDAFGAMAASLIVAAVTACRPVRIGALLSAGGVLAAYLLHTPVGLNATRLAGMFAVPVLVATARVPGWLRQPAGARFVGLAGLAAVVAWAAPPVVLADLGNAGDPANERSYYTPLADALRRYSAVRVEVVPTRNYWEAAYVAPLARGWLRQVDLDRNPLFYEKLPGGRRLTPENYLAWLRDNGVSHVALADTELSWLAKPEAALIEAGLPYLTQVWRDDHWRLYQVTDPSSIVDPVSREGAAFLVDQNDTSVTFDTTVGGEVLVKIRYSRWLRLLPGGTLRPAPDGWTIARVAGPGRYTINS